MICCQCQGIEEIFNQELARKELSAYRKKGPDQTTRQLVEVLERQPIQGSTLLDIGGGVGAIQHALLDAGVAHAQDVDASHAYLAAAREEAERRGLADQIQFQHGNFVELAPQVHPADIVTLDRVICCYPEMEKMVGLSAAKARRYYGLVFPRDEWWIKLGIKLINTVLRIRKSPFRTFVHPSQRVEALVEEAGFTRIAYSRTLAWQVAVYRRE